MVGLVMLGGLVVTAAFAPWIAPYEPNQVLIGTEDVGARQPPCIHLLGCPADQPQHLMGTDSNVRDLFSRVVYGSRYSLIIGFTAVTFAILIGTFLGALAGQLGGGIDNGIMRVMDVLLAFPALLLAIAIVAVLGPGLLNALIAIGIVSSRPHAPASPARRWTTCPPPRSRAPRGSSSSSAPNALTPLIVVATLGIATAILTPPPFRFGLAQPPTPEWGRCSARTATKSSPRRIWCSSAAIMITVPLNLLGMDCATPSTPAWDARDPSSAKE
jgi:ABC-type dipeptide/oligopeptide/nickel transport system permease subunit